MNKALLIAAAIFSTNCATQYNDHLVALEIERGFIKTAALEAMRQDADYIVLIDAYDDVKRLSKLLGFSGQYGHIEAVRNGKAYGCRPPVCSEIPISELEQMFDGDHFEIREVPIQGSSAAAIQWFRTHLQGVAYDLFYNNCTDALVAMYSASGDASLTLAPVDVNKTYLSNTQLREFMQTLGIPKPRREQVYFPDQFTKIGKKVAQGTFGR